ncbi:MAG: DUF393 domain-containing protein [Pseudomonadota bacterium]
MSSSNDTLQATEAYYDGACPLCRREVAVYRNMKGLTNINWVDVSEPERAPQGVSQADALARFHIRRENGDLASGASAFFAIWRRSPRLRWLAIALDQPPLVNLSELAYRVFLRLRPLWRRS